jgi:hypothetical protein
MAVQLEFFPSLLAKACIKKGPKGNLDRPPPPLEYPNLPIGQLCKGVFV